ncbi:MAG: fibronectin type III domain-containing protein [Gammaproteobacteria bacterium]
MTAVAAANQVTLQWTAPASDGGSAITGYRYRWSNDSDANTWESAGGAAGEAIANSASLGEYLIGSLTNGVHYVFQVAAQNATATGDWSASVRARPLGLPGVPSGVSASAVNEGLVVRWAGGSAGGASGSARRYQVRWRLGSAAAFAAGDLVDAADAPDTLSHVLGGLSNGSEYVVQVRAKTLGGESAWSADARGTPSGFNFAMLDGVAGASSKDGILAARYLAGARGGALSVGLGLAAGVAETAALNIAANLSLLDVDGNNATNAADGIMIARYMLGVVSGAGLYEGQADAADVDDVIANIQALLPQ